MQQGSADAEVVGDGGVGLIVGDKGLAVLGETARTTG